jgi:serine/threonine protein kinase
MRSILKCIEFCHNNGVVHRDIKLENLMFKRKGDLTSAKLIDFGLSKNIQN